MVGRPPGLRDRPANPGRNGLVVASHVPLFAGTRGIPKEFFFHLQLFIHFVRCYTIWGTLVADEWRTDDRAMLCR